MPDTGLKDKIAVITGGGTGLGRQTALGLSKEGVKVVLASLDFDSVREVQSEIERQGGEALALHTDVSDEQAVKQMVAKSNEKYGGVDILINNAAIYPSKSHDQISVEEWDRVFAVNVKGYFLCAQNVLPNMKYKGWGRIVNVSSITYYLGFENILHYVSTKGSVIGLTRSLAREVGRYGVTVNSIAPGAFPTEAEEIHADPEAYNKYVLENQSIKRRGHPDDIANAIIFFTSEMSSFVTGQSLLVDGGWAMN